MSERLDKIYEAHCMPRQTTKAAFYLGYEVSGCYTEAEEDDSGSAIAVNVMKDGNLCWSANKVDILFELALREG